MPPGSTNTEIRPAPQDSPFFSKLPAELRNKIYRIVFTPRPIVSTPKQGPSISDLAWMHYLAINHLPSNLPPPNHHLLLSCRQAYSEARDMYVDLRRTYWSTTDLCLTIEPTCTGIRLDAPSHASLDVMAKIVSSTNLENVKSIMIRVNHGRDCSLYTHSVHRMVMVDKRGIWEHQYHVHDVWWSTLYSTLLAGKTWRGSWREVQPYKTKDEAVSHITEKLHDDNATVVPLVLQMKLISSCTGDHRRRSGFCVCIWCPGLISWFEWKWQTLKRTLTS